MFQRWKLLVFPTAIILAAALFGIPASKADEGMWTLDNLPLNYLREHYNFEPTPEWLENIRLASVRINDGGSGSFVSPHGLVMTNHHVALGQLQKLSTAENNLVTRGFYAPTYDQELKAPDLEINVLVSMENVTDRVLSAVKEGMTDQEAFKARESEIARIEKESLDQTGLRSDVVSLYQGGEYWLYRYKKYTDVRIVFAPEQQAAFFGGDSDNFTYPRYDLDVSFLRVYENGKPAEVQHYLRWNPKGAGEGDLVFVSGHPGSTSRLQTLDRIEFQRDFYYPILLEYIEHSLKSTYVYMNQGPEQKSRAAARIMGLENAKKLLLGEFHGLKRSELINKKKEEENSLRKKIAANPDWEAKYGDAWESIAKVTRLEKESFKEYFFRSLRGSSLVSKALNLVRYGVEVRKPDGERLPGFHDAELDTLRFQILSPAPVYKDYEIMGFTSWLELALAKLGPDDPFIKTILKDQTPAQVAAKAINGTRLDNVKEREKLLKGGMKAVTKSRDPLVLLVREVDPILRDAYTWYRDNIESVLRPATEKIAQARFAAYGKSMYPDATFTLRLAFGTVRGYPYNGTKAPYKTTLYGLFDRAFSFDNKDEFILPKRFLERKDRLNLETPVNFVTTCDITGGNSGSPVIDREGKLVGLIFDGNIESFPNEFVYDETAARAVAVHPAYIIEALTKLYDAQPLAEEIESAAKR